LDDHFGDWNWKKVVGLGASLLNKMKDALVERAQHQAAFDEFNTVISIEHCAAWLSEMLSVSKACVPSDPLLMIDIAITQAGAQLRLAELEANKLEQGIDVSLHPEVLPSILIVSSLDLEEEHPITLLTVLKHRLKSLVESIGMHVTDTQCGSIVRMCNSLHQKIETWSRVQILYMPAVLQGRHNDQHNAEDIILLLPSQMKNKPCDQCLQNNKWELRLAQVYDALEELRQCLPIHCSPFTFKCEWVCGQGANM
ncbi:hypothetical protein P692DRAFT_20747410, partial [Suillus brevipes Sb2]